VAGEAAGARVAEAVVIEDEYLEGLQDEIVERFDELAVDEARDCWTGCARGAGTCWPVRFSVQGIRRDVARWRC
jgi:hypothetical protein